MYNRYPEELIEEIRTSNDIVDVISEYIKLEKRGANYFGVCPFHKENTPSFCVSSTKQIFNCFGCGKGGNVIHFIMNIENDSFQDAIKYLADRAKITLPEEENTEEKEKARLRQEVIKINTEAARFFYSNLNSTQGEVARRYLQKRGISEQTVKKFGVGYSFEGWDALLKHLLSKDFDEKSILSSGLILPNKTGGYYDRFRGRIIFPIFDIRGNVIGFGGRVMDSSMPKYMNSPETIVYNKGRNLYALNFAKTSSTKRIIIVEGYMDVISMHQSGIINTVASLGTALTESQGRLLKKYAEEIIIAYDSDTAGQSATMRGLDLLYDIGCNVKVLVLPQGKDPDEFIRKNGADELNRLINNTLPLVEYKVKKLKEQINTDSIEGEIKLRNKIVDILVKIDNHIEREMYISKFSKDYKISEESIISEITRRTKPKSNFRNSVIRLETPNTNVSKAQKDDKKDENNKIVHSERLLLALLCTENRAYKVVKDRLSLELFSDSENLKIAEFVIEKLSNNKGIVIGELMNILDSGIAEDFAKIIQEECNCEDNTKAVMDIIKRIELFKVEKRQQEILGLLNNKNDLVEGDVEKLKIELMSLIMRKKNI